jgi:hypothetical protein
MPPQQVERLLDLINQILGFCAHGQQILRKKMEPVRERRGP